MSGKTRGYAFDVDAWVQFHLLRLASFHPDTTKADIAVLAEICGFEEVWKAYGHRQKKADARAVYQKLSPDTDLHSRIVDAARSWQASWAAQGNERAPRFTLATWLEREEFECHPPTAYKPKERKAKGPNGNAPEGGAAEEAKPDPDPDFALHPDRPASGTIEKADLAFDDEDGAKMLTVWFRTTDGGTVEHVMVVESSDPKEQERGQAGLQQLLLAAALSEIDDPADLVGRQVDLMVTHGGGFVSCSPPWVPAPRERRNVPRFTNVVSRTKPGGWALKIGTAYAEDAAAEAA